MAAGLFLRTGPTTFLNSWPAAVRAIEAHPAGSSAYKPVAFHQRAAGVLIVVGFVHTATSYVEWSSDTAFAELFGRDRIANPGSGSV